MEMERRWRQRASTLRRTDGASLLGMMIVEGSGRGGEAAATAALTSSLSSPSPPPSTSTASAVEVCFGEAWGETAGALVRFLEGHPAVAGVTMEERAGAEEERIAGWEAGAARRGWLGGLDRPGGRAQRLPRDFRDALRVNDGLQVTWDASVDGGATVQRAFGCIRYNALAELAPLDVHAGWPSDDIPPRGGGIGGVEEATVGLPNEGHGCTALCIDSRCPAGNVALVWGPEGGCEGGGGGPSSLPSPSSSSCYRGVWLQDLEGRWHILAETFTDYMRLQVVHLGLPSWQLAFTDVGLTSETEIWFRFLSPERLELDNQYSRRNKSIGLGFGKGAPAAAAPTVARPPLDLEKLDEVATEVRNGCLAEANGKSPPSRRAPRFVQAPKQ